MKRRRRPFTTPIRNPNKPEEPDDAFEENALNSIVTIEEVERYEEWRKEMAETERKNNEKEKF